MRASYERQIFVWMNAVNSKTMNYIFYLLGAWPSASDHWTRRQDHRISLWSSFRYGYRVTISTWSTVWKGVKMSRVEPIIGSETEKIKLIRDLCNISKYSWQKPKNIIGPDLASRLQSLYHRRNVTFPAPFLYGNSW